MAAQYSNRQFFRKTPYLYLSKFFKAKGIQLDVNINQLKKHDPDVFQVALNKLPPRTNNKNRVRVAKYKCTSL